MWEPNCLSFVNITIRAHITLLSVNWAQGATCFFSVNWNGVWGNFFWFSLYKEAKKISPSQGQKILNIFLVLLFTIFCNNHTKDKP